VTAATAIEAAGLCKAFGPRPATGRVQALDGLGLSVPGGTVCALLGPNGAGKTTAVRILATLTKPDSGTAIVAGHDVTREPRRVRELIGLAGQHAAVDDDLTGRENLFILGLMHTWAGPKPESAPTPCSSSSAWPTRGSGWSRRGPAACAAAWT